MDYRYVAKAKTKNNKIIYTGHLFRDADKTTEVDRRRAIIHNMLKEGQTVICIECIESCESDSGQI